jgi:hypothetical protein
LEQIVANKSKQKGTAWETAVVNYFKEHDLYAHRLPLSGAVDKGDVELLANGKVITVQCKAAKAFDLAGWLAATEAQSLAADTNHGVLIVKAPGKNISRAYVIQSFESYVRTL